MALGIACGLTWFRTKSLSHVFSALQLLLPAGCVSISLTGVYIFISFYSPSLRPSLADVLSHFSSIGPMHLISPTQTDISTVKYRYVCHRDIVLRVDILVLKSTAYLERQIKPCYDNGAVVLRPLNLYCSDFSTASVSITSVHRNPTFTHEWYKCLVTGVSAATATNGEFEPSLS
jgi:hypothetical protein